MSDETELRDRIAKVIAARTPEWLGTRTELDINEYVAQAVIDDLGLAVRGDDCGYHEIHGSYDTRFGED